jgi:signal transduction histidine kinase/CheY-like chemotaxis protein
MFSSDLTLKDFVCPIPICQPRADLETILNAFQISDCGLIAISLSQNIWGIVNCNSLLSLLTKSWQESANARVSHPRNMIHAKASLALTEAELSLIVEPAIALNDQIKAEKFLSYLKADNDSNSKKTRYLIVNSEGKLLGLLNTHKLLESFAFSLNHQRSTTQTLPNIDIKRSFLSLIDYIALPLKLETADGKICGTNSHWQKSIDKTAQKKQPKPPENTNFSIAKWWVEQQLGQQPNSPACHCLKDNHYLTPLYSPLNSNLIKQSSQRDDDWNYIKLPLTLVDSPATYWLVLATKLSSEQLDCSDYQDGQSAPTDSFKHELLANISHELKSPLTGIVGLSSLLKAQKLGELNQRQVRYVELIYSSGQKLMSIVSDLLELTNLTTGKLKLNPEQVELKPLCQQVYLQALTKLKTTVKTEEVLIHSNRNFQLTIEPGLEIAIVDKSRLSSILSHLLLEVLKFSHPQGEFGIRINSLTGWMAITVWNHNQSISESEKRSPKESSFQSESSIPPPQLETGWGLILAKKLAKAHGGDISLISKAGSCEFTLLLPKTNSQDQESGFMKSDSVPSLDSGVSVTSAKNSENRLVLIVETTFNSINNLTFQLKELGYHPIVARTNIEALNKARQLKPGYILLNPILPDLAAKDLLILLKSDSRTHNIPVFILTNHQEQAQSQSLYQEVEGFVCMPIDQAVLARIFPAIERLPLTTQRNLTILCLYPEPEVISQSMAQGTNGLDFNLKNWAERDWTNKSEVSNNYHHRIIEADGLEQAHMLARIWQLDVMVLDGHLIVEPLAYLRSLHKSEYLSTLPLVTLDARTTEAANQIDGLNVYPCLLPAECRSIADLMQVIQIAAGLIND